jgi:hypothetical protein
MRHTTAELRHRAEQCRDRASETRDGEVHGEMLELAKAFDEEAAAVELEGTYEEGYQEGWSSVAGADPLPRTPTEPLEREERTAQKGYIYGCSDAKEADEHLISHQGSNR